jgi:apolipoprotein N-acyltransferase
VTATARHDRSGDGRGLWRLAAVVTSGLALSASFPSLDLQLLAWVALVPMLVAVRGQSPRTAAGLGWLAGFSFFVPTLYWISPTISNFTRIDEAVAAGVCVLLAGVSAWTFAVFAWGLERIGARGGSRLLWAGLAWPALDWMRSFVIAPFPWAFIGYTQHDWLTMIQIADLGGVYLVSSVLVWVNAALAEMVAARRLLPAAAAVVVGLPLLTAGYGSWRLSTIEAAPFIGEVHAGFVQGNVPQSQKWDDKLQDEILAGYLDLSRDAVAAGAKLVVWPEASVPFFLELDARTDLLADFAREQGVYLLVGAPGYEDRDGTGARPYNQAWLVTPQDLFLGPYDKIQLVPFGEYIPLGGLFGMVDVVVEAVGQLGAGTEHVLFAVPMEPLPGVQAPERAMARFGTLICYEGIFPELTRQFVVEGADFLINISNDAWYGDTSAPWQHLSMVAMRAVENRLPVLRSTNTGVSAFIGPDGSVGGKSALFRRDMGVQSVMLRDLDSLYRHVGNGFVYGALALALALLALAHRRGTTPD